MTAAAGGRVTARLLGAGAAGPAEWDRRSRTPRRRHGPASQQCRVDRYSIMLCQMQERLQGRIWRVGTAKRWSYIRVGCKRVEAVLLASELRRIHNLSRCTVTIESEREND